MQKHRIVALLALSLASCLAAPQNKAEVDAKEAKSVVPAAERRKGALETLESIQNDGEMVRICSGMECTFMPKKDAVKVEDLTSAARISKGNDALTKGIASMAESAQAAEKGMDSQRVMLEALKAQLEAINSASNKGAQLAANTKSLYGGMMSSMDFSAQGKGMAAAMPPSKGMQRAPMPPSKGGSAASSVAATMQLEAAMCPMTMYELGKSQKLFAEAKSRMESANAMNAMLMSQKNHLESQKVIGEAAKARAEQQAAFNAKYAAEQKNKADMLAAALSMANAEKANLEKQKAELEAALGATQNALAQEKANSAALAGALSECNDEKATLEAEKAALTDELKQTANALRETQAELENERRQHERTRRQLEATQEELVATEEARLKLEQAKQELEDELAETKTQLEAMTAERDQLQVTLDSTSAMLASCTAEKMQCQDQLAEEKAMSAELSKQLNEALVMLNAEKKAREELTDTIMMVKAASEKVQEEVKRLQLENVQLQQQIAKLKSEQETAMAMAAGCPPTYEKFGLSCYKYVREKTQWKMAQEQCMKDGGNLVSIENRAEQAFLVDYLKRHGASDTDAYSLTSGNKQMNHWKWLGSSEQYIGQSGPEYWFNMITKNKPNYNCQAMYLRDSSVYGKWVGLPCYSAAPFTCEYLLAPPGTASPANAAEAMHTMEMYKEAPAYLQDFSMSKGALSFAPPSMASKGMALSFGAKGFRRF